MPKITGAANIWETFCLQRNKLINLFYYLISFSYKVKKSFLRYLISVISIIYKYKYNDFILLFQIINRKLTVSISLFSDFLRNRGVLVVIQYFCV